MRRAALLAAIALTACGEPDARGDTTLETPEGQEAVQPPPADNRDVQQRYRLEVTGRWAERPGCSGMSWNFQADSFTTPGETHCADVDVSEGGGGAVRVHGRDCRAEGADQPDIVLDVTPRDDRLTVRGVDSPISTTGWPRCL